MSEAQEALIRLSLGSGAVSAARDLDRSKTLRGDDSPPLFDRLGIGAGRPAAAVPREEPVEGIVGALGAGMQSGLENIRAQNRNFRAALNTIAGRDERAENLLRQGNFIEQQASIPLAGMESFEDFLDEPSAHGFFMQMASATGQFIPSLAASLAEAVAVGALASGATVLSGGTATPAILGTAIAAQRLGRKALRTDVTATAATAAAAGRGLTNDQVEDIIERKFKNSISSKKNRKVKYPLTPQEEEILEYYIYPALKQQLRGRRFTQGMLLGAYSQEQRMGTGIAFSDYADQDMKSPEDALASIAQGQVFGLIGVGTEAIAFQQAKRALNKNLLQVKRPAPGQPKPFGLQLERPSQVGGFLKDLTNAQLTLAFTEGLAEGLQEELSISQKKRIDANYTNEQARIERLNALFAGFFGGIGVGTATGGATGVTNLVRESAQYKRMVEEANRGLTERYLESKPGKFQSILGKILPERPKQLKAQLDFMLNPDTLKDSMFVPLESANAFVKVQKDLPANTQSIDTIIGEFYSTNPAKVAALQNIVTVHPSNVKKVEDWLASEGLEYSDTRRPEHNAVVGIFDNLLKELVHYHSTYDDSQINTGNEQTDLDIAIKQMQKILNKGDKKRYTVVKQTLRQHKAYREEGLTQSDMRQNFRMNADGTIERTAYEDDISDMGDNLDDEAVGGTERGEADPNIEAFERTGEIKSLLEQIGNRSAQTQEKTNVEYFNEQNQIVTEHEGKPFSSYSQAQQSRIARQNNYVKKKFSQEDAFDLYLQNEFGINTQDMPYYELKEFVNLHDSKIQPAIKNLEQNTKDRKLEVKSLKDLKDALGQEADSLFEQVLTTLTKKERQLYEKGVRALTTLPKNSTLTQTFKERFGENLSTRNIFSVLRDGMNSVEQILTDTLSRFRTGTRPSDMQLTEGADIDRIPGVPTREILFSQKKEGAFASTDVEFRKKAGGSGTLEFPFTDPEQKRRQAGGLPFEVREGDPSAGVDLRSPLIKQARALVKTSERPEFDRAVKSGLFSKSLLQTFINKNKEFAQREGGLNYVRIVNDSENLRTLNAASQDKAVSLDLLDTPINVHYGANENATLSNLAYRPFTISKKAIQDIYVAALTGQGNPAFTLMSDKDKKKYFKTPKEAKAHVKKALQFNKGAVKFYSVEHAYQVLKGGNLKKKAVRDVDSKYRKLGQQGKAGKKFAGPIVLQKTKNKALDDKVNAPRFAYTENLMKYLIKASMIRNPKTRKLLESTGNITLTHRQEQNPFWQQKFPELLAEVRTELQQDTINKGKAKELEEFIKANEKRSKAIAAKETEIEQAKLEDPKALDKLYEDLAKLRGPAQEERTPTQPELPFQLFTREKAKFVLVTHSLEPESAREFLKVNVMEHRIIDKDYELGIEKPAKDRAKNKDKKERDKLKFKIENRGLSGKGAAVDIGVLIESFYKVQRITGKRSGGKNITKEGRRVAGFLDLLIYLNDDTTIADPTTGRTRPVRDIRLTYHPDGIAKTKPEDVVPLSEPGSRLAKELTDPQFGMSLDPSTLELMGRDKEGKKIQKSPSGKTFFTGKEAVGAILDDPESGIFSPRSDLTAEELIQWRTQTFGTAGEVGKKQLLTSNVFAEITKPFDEMLADFPDAPIKDIKAAFPASSIDAPSFAELTISEVIELKNKLLDISGFTYLKPRADSIDTRDVKREQQLQKERLRTGDLAKNFEFAEKIEDEKLRKERDEARDLYSQTVEIDNAIASILIPALNIIREVQSQLTKDLAPSDMPTTTATPQKEEYVGSGKQLMDDIKTAIGSTEVEIKNLQEQERTAIEKDDTAESERISGQIDEKIEKLANLKSRLAEIEANPEEFALVNRTRLRTTEARDTVGTDVDGNPVIIEGGQTILAPAIKDTPPVFDVTEENIVNVLAFTEQNPLVQRPMGVVADDMAALIDARQRKDVDFDKKDKGIGVNQDFPTDIGQVIDRSETRQTSLLDGFEEDTIAEQEGRADRDYSKYVIKQKDGIYNTPQGVGYQKDTIFADRENLQNRLQGLKAAKLPRRGRRPFRIQIRNNILDTAKKMGLARNLVIMPAERELSRRLNFEELGINEKQFEERRTDFLLDRTKTAVTFKYGDRDVILLKSDEAISDGVYFASFMKELGNAFVNQELEKSLKVKKIRNKLLKAFEEVLKRKDAPQKYQDPENGFNDFIADQFATAVRTRLGLPNLNETSVETFKSLNPTATGWFKRLANQLLKLYNTMLSDQQKVRFEINETAQEYIDGVVESLTDPSQGRKVPYPVKVKIENQIEAAFGPETYTDKALASALAQTEKIFRSKNMPRWLRAIFFTADTRLREFSPALADFFNQAARSVSETGLFTLKNARTQRYVTDIAKILGLQDSYFYSSFTKEQRKILDDAARDDIPTENLSPKAQEIRRYLTALYNELDLGDLGVEFRRNFFPRVIAIYDIASDTKKQQALRELLREKNPQASNYDIDNAVQELIDKGNGDVELEANTEMELGVLTKRKYLFDKLTNFDLSSRGLSEDPEVALKKYFERLSMKIEFNKKGGAAKLDQLLSELGDAERSEAEDIINSMLGRVKPIQNGWLRRANNMAITLNVVTLLGMTTIASLQDTAGPILRSRELNMSNVASVLKNMIKNPQEAQELAKEIGVIGVDAMSTFFIMAGETDHISRGAKEISNVWFRVTLLEAFTRFTRVFATGMGTKFLTENARKAKAGDATAKLYLDELNADPDEVLLWEKGKGDKALRERVNSSLARFVDESILRPNPAQRPTYANDPRYAVVWQLKSFYYAYGKNIVGPTLRDAKNNFVKGGIGPGVMPIAFMAAMLLPITMLGWEIRELFKYGVSALLPGISPNDPGVNYFKTNTMSSGEYWTELIDRSGMLGPASLALPVFLESHRYGKPFWVPPLGPTAERIYDGVTWQWRAADYIPVYSQLDTRALGR